MIRVVVVGLVIGAFLLFMLILSSGYGLFWKMSYFKRQYWADIAEGAAFWWEVVTDQS